jgi:SAM-dependent methyltransferase
LLATTDAGAPVDPYPHYGPAYGAFDANAPVRTLRLDGPSPTHERLGVAGSRMAWLERLDVGAPLRVLDVGCGSGRMALALQRALPWHVTGIEQDRAAAEAAATQGLDVHVGTLEDFEPDERFDVVLLIHVLEHMPDPLPSLLRARELLRPDGRLVVALPNAGSIERRAFRRHWDGWDIPRHVHHFDRRSLRNTLEQAGFAPGPIRHEVYSLVGRSLANLLLPQTPYDRRRGRLRAPRVERRWALLAAALRTSSAMQVVAAPA